MIHSVESMVECNHFVQQVQKTAVSLYFHLQPVTLIVQWFCPVAENRSISELAGVLATVQSGEHG